MNTAAYIFKHEKASMLSFALFAILVLMQKNLAAFSLWSHVLLLVFIFSVMMISIFNVVKHADVLAERLGEPYGTLILTLSVISVEVALIIAMTLIGHAQPTLARDTMLAVVIIAVNGFAGIALFIGGIRHKTQKFNLQGTNAFLAVLIPMSVLCLILPNFTNSGHPGEFSFYNAIIMIALCALLYITFLIMQTMTHADSFTMLNLREKEAHDAKHCSANASTFHVIFLFLSLIGLILLSKPFSLYLNHSLNAFGLPPAFGGFLIALLILMPEGYSAIYSAYENQLQRSVNLCLGSALATIGLTVPFILAITLYLNQHLILGLTPVETILLTLTLGVSLTTFGSEKTNFLNGAVHLSLFFIYMMLLLS